MGSQRVGQNWTTELNWTDAEWSKSNRDKYDIAYMWNLKRDKNELIYFPTKNRFTEVENKFMVTRE